MFSVSEPVNVHALRVVLFPIQHLTSFRSQNRAQGQSLRGSFHFLKPFGLTSSDCAVKLPGLFLTVS